MSLPHWEYFLSIEYDLENCTKYVNFSYENYECFSIQFARIIMDSCSEIDTVMKLICKSISPSEKPKTILKYYPIINSKYPNFTKYKMLIPRYKICLCPWKDWSKLKAPYWWSKGYNKIKHERDKFFREANLYNALNSTSGLLCILLYYYNECFDDSSGIDSRHAPRLFMPHDPTGIPSGSFWYYYRPDI